MFSHFLLFLLKKALKIKISGNNFVKKKAQKQKVKNLLKKGTMLKKGIKKSQGVYILLGTIQKLSTKHYGFWQSSAFFAKNI